MITQWRIVKISENLDLELVTITRCRAYSDNKGNVKRLTKHRTYKASRHMRWLYEAFDAAPAIEHVRAPAYGLRRPKQASKKTRRAIRPAAL